MMPRHLADLDPLLLSLESDTKALCFCRILTPGGRIINDAFRHCYSAYLQAVLNVYRVQSFDCQAVLPDHITFI